MSNVIKNFKTTREMKDSGIECIGEVPKGWEILSTKHLFEKIFTGNSLNDSEKNVYSTNNEGYPYISTKDIDSDNCSINYKTGLKIPYNSDKFKIAQKNSILLCIEGGSAGRKICITDRDISFVNKLCSFHSSSNLNKYLFYLLASECFRQPFFLNMSGLIGGVSVSKLKEIKLPIPPLREQQAIANYLDEKVGKIDELIAEQNKAIKNWKVYKQSLITETVTKGLNSNAEMKDSGIEWIGEIPNEWEVKKLRYLGSCKNGISKGAEYFGYGYPFVSYGDVYQNFSIPSQVEGLIDSTEEERNLYSVEEGDIFFTRTSETKEEVGLTSVCLETIPNATFAGFVIRFRPRKGILNKNYAKYYFRGEKHRAFFIKEMNVTTRASLGQGLLKNLPVLIPPLLEQQAIADFLDEKCSKIDQTIEQKQTLIKQLEEYKQSLIYECVTGKRCVL